MEQGFEYVEIAELSGIYFTPLTKSMLHCWLCRDWQAKLPYWWRTFDEAWKYLPNAWLIMVWARKERELPPHRLLWLWRGNIYLGFFVDFSRWHSNSGRRFTWEGSWRRGLGQRIPLNSILVNTPVIVLAQCAGGYVEWKGVRSEWRRWTYKPRTDGKLMTRRFAGRGSKYLGKPGIGRPPKENWRFNFCALENTWIETVSSWIWQEAPM